MTRKIFKFAFENGRTRLAIRGPIIKALNVGVQRVEENSTQRETIVIWCEVSQFDDSEDIDLSSFPNHEFAYFGTGHSIDPAFTEYVGTAVDGAGQIWHVYKRGFNGSR